MTLPSPGRGRRDDARETKELERSLARHSAEELVAALGLRRAPAPVRAGVRAAFAAVSVPLGKALAHFDRNIETLGLSRAAAGVLADLGARWTRLGAPPPARGPLLVVSNHPGAYDALVLMASIERDDLAIVAADRALLRDMPGLQPHLVFIPDAPAGKLMGRVSGLRRALAHIARGGALLHFGAGRIEPDPAFLSAGSEHLAAWPSGAASLLRGTARSGGVFVPAVVAGVHSARAKSLFVTRLAERHGLTTLAPLLQVSLRRYRDVEAIVRFGGALSSRSFSGDDARIAAAVRDEALALWPIPRHSVTGVDQHPMKRADRLGPRR
jgi:hypothetical protein